jgi:TolB-like protein
VVLAITLRRTPPGPPPENAAVVQNRPTVLVLPFRSIQTVGSEDHLYGHALADSIVASLATIQGLTILSPPSATPDTGSASESDPAVAASLNADYLISGQFNRKGDSSSATAKLVQVSDGSVLWSRTYRFPWSALISAEQEMSSAVASRISDRIGQTSQRAEKPAAPASSDAYQEFLAGYYGAVQTRQTANLTVFENARRHLDRAIALEPSYAEAHSTLANLLLFRCIPWLPEHGKFVDLAESHARLAIQYSPRHPGALAALARSALYRRDPENALRLAADAVAASPLNVESLGAQADVYTAVGLHESALHSYQAAARRPFVTVEPYVFGTLAALRLGDRKAAGSLMSQHDEVDPEGVLNLATRAAYLSQVGTYPESERIHLRLLGILENRNLPESMKRQINGFAGITHALNYARWGNHQTAKAVAAKLGPPLPRRAEYEILLLAALGRKQEALQTIEQSIFFNNYRFLITEPGLRPLYSEPGFKALLDKAYPRWQAVLREFGPSLPARPPLLPTPVDFLLANRS